MTQEIEFHAKTPGERLDKLVVEHLGDLLSRSQIQTLIKDGSVRINGESAKSGWRLKGGETIAIVMPPPPPPQEVVPPEDIPLDIVYEDEYLAVINKPAGLVVHPGSGNERGTLVNAILARYPEIGLIDYAPQRRGIVHRLDKETSGLILIAKSAVAMRRLMIQFQDRSVEKTYVALVEKAPKTITGRIDAPIDRDPINRKRMTTRHDGRAAVSEFKIVERYDSGHALVRVKPLTGRTHQIRVHMAFVGAPLVGDRVYGYRRQRIPMRGQFLHAERLCFNHPYSGERLCFDAPIPPHLQTILDSLRRGTLIEKRP